MATLAEIRQQLLNKAKAGTPAGIDNSVFPHWNINEGQTATIRFLPDGDNSNTFFWTERQIIRLPFNGIKGEVNSKQVVVQVPCMEMWNESCPILTEVRPWFKDTSLTDMGRKYWKKKSYIFQGFVVDSKLQEENPPENPIRRFIMGGQIFNIIHNALMDSEIDEVPTHYVRGLDFRISKTKKGEYADYNTSSWARRERALSEREMEAIEKYGLFKLKDFLPKKPTDVELKIIQDMFQASVDGEAYDPDSWGKYFKPNSSGDIDSLPSSTNRSATVPMSVSRGTPTTVSTVDDDDDTSTSQTDSASSNGKEASSRAADIIAMIRNRKSSE